MERDKQKIISVLFNVESEATGCMAFLDTVHAALVVLAAIVADTTA